MIVELIKTTQVKAAFLEVSAGVRYWEDATVNGVDDGDGTLIPLRNGENWTPVIDLSTGAIKNWPAGTAASVHYKVADQGEYWLQDENGQRIAKWRGYYVPDDLLAPGADGLGDYIILEIDGDGKIEGWNAPAVGDSEQWEAV